MIRAVIGSRGGKEPVKLLALVLSGCGGRKKGKEAQELDPPV